MYIAAYKSHKFQICLPYVKIRLLILFQKNSVFLSIAWNTAVRFVSYLKN